MIRTFSQHTPLVYDPNVGTTLQAGHTVVKLYKMELTMERISYMAVRTSMDRHDS